MGWVERAAIIGHTDSTCPYGEHVSVYVKILPLDHDYCWVQHYFYAYKIKIKLQRLFFFLFLFFYIGCFVIHIYATHVELQQF